LNQTTTVMGNHLYHEAALRGNCSFPLPLLLCSDVNPRFSIRHSNVT
jgi:hypothetical protein